MSEELADALVKYWREKAQEAESHLHTAETALIEARQALKDVGRVVEQAAHEVQAEAGES